MSPRDRQYRICILLLALNLCFIWGNSLLPAEYSQAFSDWVQALLPIPQAVEDAAVGGSGLLRKIAHFTEFTALGLLLRWRYLLLGRKGWKAFPWGLLAACVDETIQVFVPGRGPGLLDVGIDACGVLAGMLLLQTGYDLWKRKQPTHYGGNGK